MENFNAKQVSYTYTQTNDAPPEKVFPLLCPVREKDWLPGWEHRLIYSVSGLAEDGCVFSTPTATGGERTWMTTHFDPSSYTIAYAWVEPAMLAAQLRISLKPIPADKTHTHIRYIYTALSAAGNTAIAEYSPEWFQSRMQHWERCINHYLLTGTLLKQ